MHFLCLSLLFPLYRRSHTSESKELNTVQKRLVLNLLENLNVSNCDVAKHLNCDKKIIRNLQCHVKNKKNINLNNDLVSN